MCRVAVRAGSREAVALWGSLCHTGLAARMLSSELEMYPMIAVAPEMAMVRTAGSIRFTNFTISRNDWIIFFCLK